MPLKIIECILILLIHRNIPLFAGFNAQNFTTVIRRGKPYLFNRIIDLARKGVTR